MKSSYRLLSFIAVALSLNSSAVFGGTISNSGSFSFPLSPNTAIVSLDLFNPLLGTLNSVQLIIDGTVEAAITGENDSAIGGNMSINLTGILGVTAPGLSANAGIFTSAGPVAVAATDGTAGSGPDFNDFGLLSGTGNANATIVSAVDVAAFNGPGTFNANVSGNGGFNISGVTASTLQISSFEGFGTVTVVYNYTATVVPEPSSALALGAVAVVGLVRRRNRRPREA